MIYQVRTFNPLCTSKHYCKDVKGVHEWIALVVQATNQLRQRMDEAEASGLHWDHPVTRMDMENGIVVTTVDDTALPDWEKYFGKGSPITDPILRIENGIKIYPKRKEMTCGK